MTPKEKAEELVERFMLWKFQKCELSKKQAKQCALICVDEIIDLGLLYGDAPFGDSGKQFHSYWQQVKTEIEKQ